MPLDLPSKVAKPRYSFAHKISVRVYFLVFYCVYSDGMCWKIINKRVRFEGGKCSIINSNSKINIYNKTILSI